MPQGEVRIMDLSDGTGTLFSSDWAGGIGLGWQRDWEQAVWGCLLICLSCIHYT